MYTRFSMGRKFSMMKNAETGLKLHEQMTTMLKWMY
jgi:hypothetical protein